MFGLGTQELLLIFAIALLIFGPKKLPELARSTGKAIREFRKASSGLLDEEEEKKSAEKKEKETVAEAEKVEKIKVKEQ
ncbi:MAG: twin-arginine translocase TatA/TatE family subunit [Desulfurobacterium sp.]|nr:MAG: twin-arginine translocase TatA/TatE family subunit [Desulfurobacterium sp.]